MNFVDSPVSTVIAELLYPSPGEAAPAAPVSHGGSDLPTTSVFIASFPRSHPALGASLSQLVEIEPYCLLERTDEFLEHVSLSCDGFLQGERDLRK